MCDTYHVYDENVEEGDDGTSSVRYLENDVILRSTGVIIMYVYNTLPLEVR